MDPLVRSARVDDLFGEDATLSRYLEVEIALAAAQAEIGLIPREAAEALSHFASPAALDRDRLRDDHGTVGFPIVGLVRQLAQRVPDGQGEFAHWGATTQDIMDTGLVLALRTLLGWVDDALHGVTATLAALASAHRRTPMIGRSQMQHAVPITFGLKVVGWLGALERHRCRLSELKPRLLRAQLGGAAGSLASLGLEGFEVRKRLAARLGLADPNLSWHTHRDSLAELVSALGLITASLGKIATDIILLAQTEVAELREPAKDGRGTSSTMPQKRNPVLSQHVLVAARLVRPQVSAMLEAMVQDHERGSASWQMEWTLIPTVASHTMAALERTQELLEGIEVDTERMAANLGQSRGLVYSEAVMMVLAPVIGRQRAHDLVVDAVRQASANGVGFRESVERSSAITSAVSVEDLRRCFSGELHTEMANENVGHALASRDAARATRRK